MKLLRNKLAAGTALAVLGMAGLFAQATLAPRRAQREGRFVRLMATVLNLTDAQRAQAKSIFQDARRAAQPIRQELMETRKSLEAAVQAGNTQQIQQLSATAGNEAGQLTAIRSSAFANVYKTLTSEQKGKWTAVEQAMHPRRRAPGAGAASE